MPSSKSAPPKCTLAIESSTRQFSCALFRGFEFVEEIWSDLPSNSVRSLVPSAKKILSRHNFRMDDMGLIGLTIGPGSFTGLRIATTFAKTFAYATGAQVRAINTLRVLAFQAATSRQIATYESIIAILDAQRQQLFAAEYKLNEEGEMVEQVPTSIRSREFLNSCSDSELITGIGLRKVDLKNMNLNLAAEAAWHPTAKSTGRLAIADYQQGIVDDIWTLKPAYFRKSAAEEKAEQNSD